MSAGPEIEAADSARPEGDLDPRVRSDVQGIPRFWKDPEIVETLGLSDQQIQAFELEAQNFIEHLGSSRRLMRVSYQKLIAALNQDPVNEQVIESAARGFREAGADRYRLMTGQLLEFRRILTQKQWKELRVLRPRALKIDRFRPVVSESSARAFISGEDPGQNGSAEKLPHSPDDN